MPTPTSPADRAAAAAALGRSACASANGVNVRRTCAPNASQTWALACHERRRRQPPSSRASHGFPPAVTNPVSRFRQCTAYNTRYRMATGKRAPLSRERILEAAAELAGRDGLDALSMRRLAQELDVWP